MARREREDENKLFGIGDDCSICMSEPIGVLLHCDIKIRHALCMSCLKKMSAQNAELANESNDDGTTTRVLRCPFCRKSVTKYEKLKPQHVAVLVAQAKQREEDDDAAGAASSVAARAMVEITVVPDLHPPPPRSSAGKATNSKTKPDSTAAPTAASAPVSAANSTKSATAKTSAPFPIPATPGAAAAAASASALSSMTAAAVSSSKAAAPLPLPTTAAAAAAAAPVSGRIEHLKKCSACQTMLMPNAFSNTQLNLGGRARCKRCVLAVKGRRNRRNAPDPMATGILLPPAVPALVIAGTAAAKYDTLRQCSECDEALPRRAYSDNQWAVGLGRRCAACQRTTTASVATPTMMNCSHCKQTKSRGDFTVTQWNKNGARMCMACKVVIASPAKKAKVEKRAVQLKLRHGGGGGGGGGSANAASAAPAPAPTAAIDYDDDDAFF